MVEEREEGEDNWREGGVGAGKCRASIAIIGRSCFSLSVSLSRRA